MLLSKLRSEWTTLRTRVQHLPSAAHQDRVPAEAGEEDGLSLEEVLQVCLTVPAEAANDAELAARSVAQLFETADLLRRGLVCETDWLHHGLLLHQAPSQHDMAVVNAKLKLWLAVDRGAQDRLLEDFLSSCQGHPEPWLTVAQATRIIHTWIQNGSRSKTLPIQHLHRVLRSKEFESEARLTYYDFSTIMLGCPKAAVQLHKFDISQGHARWLSPALVGEELKGIWHTSVVVFGREYWYGGKVLFAEPPGNSPWGKPTEIYNLPGSTLRSQKELHQFLATEAAHLFTTESYDVLTNNCNHFTDAVCKFLLNCHLPKDVLEQPDFVIGAQASPALQLLRPMLNQAFGGFGVKAIDNLSTARVGVSPDFIARMQKERALLQPNSYVLWQYREGWQRTALLLSISACETTCDLRWLDLLTGHYRTARSVSIRAVRPPLYGNLTSAALAAARAVEAVEVTQTGEVIGPREIDLDELFTQVPSCMQASPQPKRRANKSLQSGQGPDPSLASASSNGWSVMEV